MKKRTILLLTLAMLLSLTACLSNSGPKDEAALPESQQPADVQPEEPESPAAPTEPDEPDAEPDQPAAAPDEPAEAPDGTEDVPLPEEEYVIRISHTDVTMRSAGDTFRLTVWDSNGDAPDVCTYTSADPAVAAVDEGGGEVTAVAPGTTTVTAHVEFGGEKLDLDCIVRCKWETGEDQEPSQPASGVAERASLSDFFATLQGNYESLDAMMVMEGELLDNYYPGLSGIASVEEVLIQETMVSISNVAVGMVKLSSDASQDDVVAVQNILQGRIDTQAGGGAWYPESCETWGQGIVTSTANVVGMFVHPSDAQAMADLFIMTFGN